MEGRKWLRQFTAVPESIPAEESHLRFSPKLYFKSVGACWRRNRGNFRSTLFTPELNKAAKELREREDIIIRKGYKATVYIIMEKTTYLEKMDTILENPAKFQRLQKYPSNALKKKIKSLTQQANRTIKHFNKAIGDFRPGYCYGTVKTHKPVRSVSSVAEFIDLLRTAPPCRDIASLDVESLFTNVPVDDTIDIILNRVYRSDRPMIDIPKDVLKSMLETCTKEAPFFSHRGELFGQVDGVAMGSPLEVLFANMYMAHDEEKTFHHQPSPGIYARYIDDIIITTNSNEDVPNLISAFLDNSCLTFTHEQSVERRLPFLDLDISKIENGFNTKVYTKDTNIRRCLNAHGECPAGYKRSVAAAYVNRALTHCSSWRETHSELDRIRHLLTNNGFSNQMIEDVIKKKLDQYATPDPAPNQVTNQITIYHQNHFHSHYKLECNAIKDILKRGVIRTDKDSSINVRIFCKANLTRSLIMKNSTTPKIPKEASTNVVYKFTCLEGCCDNSFSHIARPQEHLAHQRSHRQLDPEPPQEHSDCQDSQQHQYPHHTGPRTRSQNRASSMQSMTRMMTFPIPPSDLTTGTPFNSAYSA
ncbi:uncharacterized protein LOC143041604 [Oratosquilla oratoria]|uniref:uncharacterized protein LOC143041604 n=1 Tax=Oratosquilla oratoria TaxID=337810 RepID=UPI003F7772A5